MNAFGKRNGLGQRPNFGVAKPMKSGPGGGSGGGEQFPPLDEAEDTEAAPAAEPAFPTNAAGAMDRLNPRQNASGEAASSKQEGFEDSDHLIK